MAEVGFEAAMGNFKAAGGNGDVRYLAFGLTQMAGGMKDLAVGIRATYQKLEDIEKLLRRTNSFGGPGGVSLRDR
jgi:hypothetical protein